MTELGRIVARWNVPGRTLLSGLPGGLDALLIPQLVKEAGNRGVILVCLDDGAVATVAEQLAFFDSTLRILRFPGWDCLPYDRVSPSAGVVAERLSTLAALARPQLTPFLVLTTVNAMLQRTIAAATVAKSSWSAAPGNRVNGAELQGFLADNGYSRTGTVVDPGGLRCAWRID